MRDLERLVLAEYALEPVVAVLVDEQDSETPMRLRLQRGEEAFELRDAPYSGEHEVERREFRPRHGRRLRDACELCASARLRSPRRSRRRALRPPRPRERSPAVVLRPRARR